MNPFRERAELAFALPADGTARLTVFDVSGRRVRTLVDGSVAAGEHVVVWDGADARGRAVAAGSYFVRLEVPSYAPLVKRLLLVR
jgi:flagellar hook assembly protein FlgD